MPVSRLLLSLVFAVLLVLPANAQTMPELFSPAEAQRVMLQPDHAERFQELQTRPWVKQAWLVRTPDPIEALTAPRFTMRLGPLKRFDAITHGVTQTAPDALTWVGRLAGDSSEDPLMYSFSVADGGMYGRVEKEGTTYHIEPVGSGFHAVYTIDYSKTPPEHPAAFSDFPALNQHSAGSGTSSEMQKSFSSSNTRVDVMLVYTPAVQANMAALAGAIEQETNQTMSNSAASASISVVHHQEVDYTESGTLQTDLDHLVNPSDGEMDSVHTWRNWYGADLVVLILNTGNAKGQAAAIPASANNAFAVATEAAAASVFTATHEIGHLTGCNHNTESLPDPLPLTVFENGYGFHHKTPDINTIMGVFFSGDNRIQYWSTPNKTHQGITIGTVNQENCTQVWTDRAPTMAAFKSEPPPPIQSVSISGPTALA